MSVADCNGESVNTRFAFKFNGVLGLCAVDGNIFTAVLTAADTADFGLDCGVVFLCRLDNAVEYILISFVS